LGCIPSPFRNEACLPLCPKENPKFGQNEWVLQIIFSTNMLKGLGHEQVSFGQGPRGARNNNEYSRALFNVWFVKKKKVYQGIK